MVLIQDTFENTPIVDVMRGCSLIKQGYQKGSPIVLIQQAWLVVIDSVINFLVIDTVIKSLPIVGTYLHFERTWGLVRYKPC